MSEARASEEVPLRSKYMVQCPECRELLTNSSLSKHRRVVHGVSGATYAAQFRVDLPYTAKRGRPSKAMVLERRRMAGKLASIKPVPVEMEPKISKTGPKKTAKVSAPDALGLVDTLLKALYPSGNVPLSHRPAIRDYEEATKRFLDQISVK